jgi:hypothetical protein
MAAVISVNYDPENKIKGRTKSVRPVDWWNNAYHGISIYSYDAVRIKRKKCGLSA